MSCSHWRPLHQLHMGSKFKSSASQDWWKLEYAKTFIVKILS